MTRILPNLISESDIAGLLLELAHAAPYSDDDWRTASLEFNTIELGVNIRVDKGQFQPAHRRRVEECFNYFLKCIRLW